MAFLCYRCGAQLEDQTTFCPECRAPQIRVAPPAAPSNEPSSPPLPPGTPDSVQPPSIPVPLPQNRIRWKEYMRLALPLSVVTGAGIGVIPPIGLVIFFAALIYCVNRYGRVHPGILRAGQGARLGTFSGLISYVVAVILRLAAFSHGEYRQQMMADLQRRLAANHDPRVQQFLQWASTDHGFTVLLIWTMFFLLVIFLVLSSFAGAMTITLLRRERR